MEYYCWMQYYDKDTLKTSKSSEIRYYKGHQHGIQPTVAEWKSCLEDLTSNVNTIRANHEPPLAKLSDTTVSLGADKKTRSAH